MLERNAAGEEIVLRARDDYWAGPVCVETIRIVPNADFRLVFDALNNGEIDAAYIADSNVLAEAEAGGIGVFSYAVDVNPTLRLNLREGRVANDPRIREAIWRAIDPNMLNVRAYDGSLRPASSLIHPESVLATDGQAATDYDPARASQLVEDARADGIEPALTLTVTVARRAKDAGIALESMLEAVGFDVTVESLQTNDLVTATFTGNFDAVLAALNIEPAQAATRLYLTFHSTSAGNSNAYSNPAMDEALVTALAAPNEQRPAAIAAVNDIYVADFVSPVLSNAIVGVMWRDDVTGIVVNPTNIYLFHAASVAS